MLDLLPDLFDKYPQDLNLIQIPWKTYGQKTIFSGEVVTVKCFEDNSRVKELLAQPGKGKVLVVDGGGSLRRALLGDIIAQSAVDNHWEGIVIYGAIRDVAAINTMDIGVKALAPNPIKTNRKGLGTVDEPIELNNVLVHSGMMIYVDLNGVAVCDKKLTL
ncbi:putative 4-hydroxy-4-methyl-2-oxoglutarate aldolase [Shewanella gaetbuli]